MNVFFLSINVIQKWNFLMKKLILKFFRFEPRIIKLHVKCPYAPSYRVFGTNLIPLFLFIVQRCDHLRQIVALKSETNYFPVQLAAIYSF